LKGHLKDKEWKGDQWSNAYLKEKAGQAPVRVEKRDGPGDRFGQGKEVIMSFGEFLTELEKGNENLYLTTQVGIKAAGPLVAFSKYSLSVTLCFVPLYGTLRLTDSVIPIYLASRSSRWASMTGCRSRPTR
jgi:hypothetical protein